MTGRCLTALLFVIVGGCALRPSAVEDRPELLLVKSVRIPDRSWLPWYTRWAEHLWIDYKLAGKWQRVEWNDVDHVLEYEISPTAAFADERWDEGVAVHAVVTGHRAKLHAASIRARAAGYPCAVHYRAWPGPNSNSFVAWLVDQIGLAVDLPHTALGKNFTTWVDAGLTTGGTGLHVDTLPLGVEVGLTEGVEVRLFGIGFGVTLWPPAIELPFLPAIPGNWFGS
ncbi:MAG: DUF3750 domain-containing protein [bacterium]|nr:DUF3750 domain-containing protein [bacterium]